jgi:acetyltransferase-like isoleucine patch superfamily enzyme
MKLKRFLKNKIENLKLRWARTSSKRYVKFLKAKGIKIGEGCRFYSGLKTISIDVTRPSLIEIGNDVAFNKNCKLVTHDFATKVFLTTHQEFIASSGKIKIGNNVSFGMDCTVLKNVTIGNNCFIGLGSVVTKDIPANSVAIGAPARVIATIDEYFLKRKDESIQEALDYARSIQERFNRRPLIEEFWEEFPLFLNGDDECPALPIKAQLGSAYEHFKKNNIAVFNGFDDFLKHADIE